jgi:RNA polymerase sigma-70 factor (ECF subfamily)
MPPIGGMTKQEFERVALVHTSALLRVALRLTRSRDAAEDLVQETMLRAWKSSHQFAPGTDCKAWLFRILLNLSSRRWKQAHTGPQLVELDGNEPADDRRGASPAFTRAEVLAALAQLAEEQRTALLLAVVEGFTCKEIAALLGIPIGTVMSRLGRARANLRGILSGGGQPGSSEAAVDRKGIYGLPRR